MPFSLQPRLDLYNSKYLENFREENFYTHLLINYTKTANHIHTNILAVVISFRVKANVSQGNFQYFLIFENSMS